jgi:hypothetical protein
MIGGAPVRCLSRIFGGWGWNKKLSELSPVPQNQNAYRDEAADMKEWFLEQKLRQLELDVHRNNRVANDEISATSRPQAYLVAGDGIKNDPNCLLYSRMIRRFL